MSTSIAPNPSGLCMCGCGAETSRAPQTVRRDGYVKGEHRRFIRGHSRLPPGTPLDTAADAPLVPPNPSGICLCGCGRKTPIAKRTQRRHSLVKGQPCRYVPGHHWKVVGKTRKTRISDPGPNPSGRCMCGCGEKTAIARYNDPAKEYVCGTPKRYVIGHHNRNNPKTNAALANARAARRAKMRARHAPLVEDYKRGLTYRELAAKHSRSESNIAVTLGRWRKHIEPELPYRYRPSSQVVLKRLEHEGRVPKKAAAKAKLTCLSDCRQDAEREVEIAALVAEQEEDVERGHFAETAGTVSLDASFGEGGSLHDLLRAA